MQQSDESPKIRIICNNRTSYVITSLQKYKNEGGSRLNAHKINKMDSRSVCFILWLTGFITLVYGQGFKPAGQISEACFNCLCEASTECDENMECQREGPGQYHCGPYLISYAYWKDGGKPGENSDDPLDFEKCVRSRPCAEAAIRGYMNTWADDCDGDMDIDCYDWARIHKSGASSCNSTWLLNTDYWSRFKSCYDGKDI